LTGRAEFKPGRRRKKWTNPPRTRYKKKLAMGLSNHLCFFGVGFLLCSILAAPVEAQEGGGRNGLKGLLKGGRAQETPPGEVVSAPVMPPRGARPGEGNPFGTGGQAGGGQAEVRIPSNANRTSKVAPPVLDARSPYNPKFGMPEFVPEDQYSRAAMSKGSLATARGEELKQFTPVEIREDRRKPQEPAQVEPTPEELKSAADRKKDLFDEIYMAKSPHPPLTFESTRERVPLGPDGNPVATRNVGERVLKQYVPAGKGKGPVR
jgi:hypothetical protein